MYFKEHRTEHFTKYIFGRSGSELTAGTKKVTAIDCEPSRGIYDKLVKAAG